MKTKGGSSNKLELAAVIISIINLVAIATFSYLGYMLSNQAYDVSRKNLELVNTLSNFTSVIIVDPERGFLNEGGYYSNGTLGASRPYGYLNISVTVITPHYGVLSIEMENFTVVDYFDMLDPEKSNLTSVSYYSEYDKYESPVVTGLNTLTFHLNLKSALYPDGEKMPASTTSEFPIGVLFLEATLFDANTNEISATEEFSTVIFVTIETL